MPTSPLTAPTLRHKSNGKVCFNPTTGRLIAGPSFGCACTVPCGCTDGQPTKLRVTLSGFDLPTVYAFYPGAFGYGDCNIRAPIEPYIGNVDGEYIVKGNVAGSFCRWGKTIHCVYVVGRKNGHAEFTLGVRISVFIVRVYNQNPDGGAEPGLYYWATVDVVETSPVPGPWSSAGGPLFAGLSGRLPFEDEEEKTGPCFGGIVAINDNVATPNCPPAPTTVIEGASVTIEAILDDSSSLDDSSDDAPEFCPPDPDASSDTGSSQPGSSDAGSTPGSSMPDSSEVGSSNPGSSNPGSSTPGSSTPGDSSGGGGGGGSSIPGSSVANSSDSVGGSSGTGSNPECLPCGSYDYFAGSLGTISWTFTVIEFNGPPEDNPGTISGSVDVAIEGPPTSDASWVGENVADYGSAVVNCTTGNWSTGLTVYSSSNALDVSGSGPGTEGGALITIPEGLYGDVNGHAATISGTIHISVVTCGEAG